MIIAFVLQSDERRHEGQPLPRLLTGYMAAAVRRHMPAALLAQLTTDTYPAVPGVDLVRRRPRREGEDFIAWCFASLADLAGGPEDVLQIATDVLVQRDMHHVFVGPHAAAACRYPVRDRADRAFCGDVTFLRRGAGAEQVRHALAAYLAMPEAPGQRDGWEGGQTAFTAAADARPGAVRELDFATYCRTPEAPDERLQDAAIVHFRGARKAWMPAYARACGYAEEPVP